MYLKNYLRKVGEKYVDKGDKDPKRDLRGRHAQSQHPRAVPPDRNSAIDPIRISS